MADGPIVFDGAVLGAGPRLGVAQAFLATLRAYVRIASRPCILLVPDGTEPPVIDGLTLAPGVRGLVARHTRLPQSLRRLHASLLHSPVAAIPARAPCPVVATIHDLPWRAAVRLRERGTGFAHRFAAAFALANARVVIVPSRATALALGHDLGPGIAARVRVVPHGLELPPTAAPAADLTGPFLALGDHRPRKNLERLRLAHKIAGSSVHDLPELLLLGPGQPSGFVDEATKLAQLRRARALAHVALHEGFGLPVLEALGHGVPVVCSRTASLPEVARDAAIYVDPTDAHSIAAGLVRVHCDVGLREELVVRGRARAAALRPERAAEQWRVVHAEAVSR